MEPHDPSDDDEAIAAAVRRTAPGVLSLVRSLAVAAGIETPPDTWYGIIAVAARDFWMDGNDSAHEMPTQRIKVFVEPPDNSDTPTVRMKHPRK